MVDLEPGNVGVRAADGVDWLCSYSDQMEAEVLSLIGRRVSARGVGAQITPNRGRLSVTEISVVENFEQTPLFTFERVPLVDLLSERGDSMALGAQPLLPPSVDDDELDAFLDAVLER